MQNEPSKPSRRAPVKKHPGIYYRQNARGERRYEVVYRDSEGRQRWKTAGGTLEEAKALREDLSGKKRRGEVLASNTKKTFGDVAREWMVSKANLRGRSRDDYRIKLARVEPHIGKRRISDITDRDIRALVATLSKTISQSTGKTLSPRTVRSTLVPVSGVFKYAMKHGWAGQNPILALERDDVPKAEEREQRILSREEIGKLLGAAYSERYRVLLATAIFTGLREMELLGVRWGEIDFEAGTIRVREQLSRTATEGRIPLKSRRARRDVVLMPALAKMLREYRASTIYKADSDYVFTTASGKPVSWSNVVRQGLHSTVKRAKLREPRPRFHDLRHTFASLLIAQGADVVFVSGQLGHADAGFTLRVYAHLFEQAQHAEKTRELLEAEFGNTLETGAWKKPEPARKAAVVPLPVSPANEAEAASG